MEGDLVCRPQAGAWLQGENGPLGLVPPVEALQCQPSPVEALRCQPSPVEARQCRPSPVEARRCQPSLVEVLWGRAFPVEALQARGVCPVPGWGLAEWAIQRRPLAAEAGRQPRMDPEQLGSVV